MSDLSQYYGLTLDVDISAEEIKSALHAFAVRVADPDTALTMDYIPSRITIFIDYNKVIQGIVFG